jgi:hypothetical protein
MSTDDELEALQRIVQAQRDADPVQRFIQEIENPGARAYFEETVVLHNECCILVQQMFLESSPAQAAMRARRLAGMAEEAALRWRELMRLVTRREMLRLEPMVIVMKEGG